MPRPADAVELAPRARTGRLAASARWIARERAALAVCGVAGTLVFLSFPPWELWPLGWVALAPLLCVVAGVGAWAPATPRRAFFLGWFAGFVTNTGGFHWIEELLVRFGHIPTVVALPIALLMFAYQGLTFGLAASALARAREVGVRTPLVVLAPLVWVVLEWLVPFIFPWYLANGQFRFIGFIQAADLGGVLLLTAVMVAVNAAIAEGARWLLRTDGVEPRTAALSLAGAAALLATTLGYGHFRLADVEARLAQAAPLQVGVVQVNIGIEEKSDNRAESLRKHREMTSRLRERGAELVVWEETSAATYFPRDPEAPAFRAAMKRVVGDLKVPIVFGAVTYAEPGPGGRVEQIWNTALLSDASGTFRGMADKVHLLLFGENVPVLGRFPELMRKLMPNSAQMMPGEDYRALVLPREGGDIRVGALVCYEDILPRFARTLAREATPNVFVNLTNDAWFGDTAEPYLHFALSVFRTVEHRTPMVRSVGTGVSAIVDATGRIVAFADSWREAELLAEIRPTHIEAPYTRLGDWPGILALLALSGLFVRAIRRLRM